MSLPATLEEAHEEIRNLRRDLGLEAAYTEIAKIHAALGVSPQEAKLLAILWRRRDKSTHPDRLIQAIWEGRDEPANPPGFIRILVHKVNKRAGKVIESRWGHGYHLSSEGLQRIGGAVAAPRPMRLDSRGQEWTLQGNMGVVRYEEIA